MLRFLLCLFLATASSAQAGDDFLVLRDISENHCRLFQEAPLTPSPAMSQRMEELTHTPQEFSLKTQYASAPDFSFLLPDYWQVMSWAQRVRFNHSMTALVKKRLDIPELKWSKGDCAPQIRIIEHPDQESDMAEDIHQPRPVRYQAMILMEIGHLQEKPITLTYLYRKDWNTGWKPEDMLVHNNSVYEIDSESLVKVIQTSGLDALEGYLEQVLSDV